MSFLLSGMLWVLLPQQNINIIITNNYAIKKEFLAKIAIYFKGSPWWSLQTQILLNL